MGNEDICVACGLEEPPVTKKRKGVKKAKSVQIRWICCDSCLGWFHAACVRINDSLFPDFKDYIFQCEKCCVIGCLIPRIPNVSQQEVDQMTDMSKQIEEMTKALAKLQKDAVEFQTLIKKQVDSIRTKLTEVNRSEEKRLANVRLVEGIEEKLEIIKSGARMATTCSQRVNGCRMSINKVPYRTGENVCDIVKGFLSFLGVDDHFSHVQTCFRMPVKPSKWTDRTLTPTILVEFSSREIRNQVLKRYYDKHKEAKLCNLISDLPLEYRFTVNEMLSMDTFRIRNLALRLKQRKQVQSVFVKNDNISIRLPNQERYTPVTSIQQLLELVGPDTDPDTTAFFDAQSTNNSCLQL